MSKIWWADVQISWADVHISMNRCPDLDEQMYQKSDEQMFDEQVYCDLWKDSWSPFRRKPFNFPFFCGLYGNK